jgi:opacity protein-like surface antigen
MVIYIDFQDQRMLTKLLLCLALFFVLAASPLLAATPDPADAVEWRRAEFALLKGQGEEAYPVFTRLLQKYPGHSPLRLGLARSAALTRRYQEAEDIYRDLLEKYPGDPILLNERDQVKALKAGTPTATTFSLRMRAGIIYDSNANQGADSDVTMSFPRLNIREITFRDTAKISTAAAYFGANFNFSHRLPDSSPFSFVGDAGLYIRGNEDSDLNDLKNSEWQWFRIGAGLRYARERNLFEARLKWEVFDYELTNHVISWGPELTYLRALSSTWHLVTQLSVDSRNFQRNPDRDGIYGQAAQYGRWFFGDNANSVTFGAAFLWGRPELERLRHNSWTFPVRLTLRPHEKWEISPHANFTVERYKGPATILDIEDRKDKKFRTGVDVIYKLTDSWHLEFNYSFNQDNSNSPLYDYDQHALGLGVSWGF